MQLLENLMSNPTGKLLFWLFVIGVGIAVILYVTEKLSKIKFIKIN